MTEANNCDFRAKESLENRARIAKLQQELEEDYVSRDIAEKGSLECKDLIKKITEYLNEKKTKGLNSVYSAIYSARNIIPNTAELELVVDKEVAYLANSYGYNVDQLEGGGFRATISRFICDRFLKAMPNMIQTQFWDEALSTLDPETSAEMSKYIGVLAEAGPIVVTEQKDAIFEAMDYTSYLFRKVDGSSTVRKEREERGAEQDDG